ncbi:PDR/VanB family oxidoreductase [Sphingomonas sp.]|jgi:ferredoxin-NADP reductase|uniref:PDR/VanB family oxidoreductase n=1 Tax=Sphingomonas sp. TaxID=28214 RepID=UPI0035C82D5D
MTGTGAIILRVRALEPLSGSLRRVVLEPADGGQLPLALPGAHLPLTLSGGDRVFRNSYSLTSSLDERSRYDIIVRRAERSRGGSAFIHEALAPGDTVRAAAPNSFFPIQARARKHLLIAGGIGITPFLSFLPVLRERGAWHELHVYARREELPVFEALLRDAGGNIHLHPARDARPIRALLAAQPLGTQAYTCGPEAMMAAVHAAAAELGWPAGRVQSENFGAAGGEPFTLRLARSGAEIAVRGDQTMLEALEQAGAPVRSLCRGGACGECVTGVIDGTPDHRDHFLSQAEKASGTLVMPCVSRSRTPILTLDL